LEWDHPIKNERLHKTEKESQPQRIPYEYSKSNQIQIKLGDAPHWTVSKKTVPTLQKTNQGEATQPTLPSHGDKLMSHVPRVAVPKVAEVPSKRKHEDTVDDKVASGKKNKQENSNNDKSVIEHPMEVVFTEIIDLEEEINSKRRFVPMMRSDSTEMIFTRIFTDREGNGLDIDPLTTPIVLATDPKIPVVPKVVSIQVELEVISTVVTQSHEKIIDEFQEFIDKMIHPTEHVHLQRSMQLGYVGIWTNTRHYLLTLLKMGKE
jgi:hypothetical protein